MEIDEAFPARETNPADSVKLEGYNPKLAETFCAELAGPDQRAAKQMRPGHFTNPESILGFMGTGVPKVSLPVE